MKKRKKYFRNFIKILKRYFIKEIIIENGKWKLDDCTMWSGLTENYFVGTEDMYNKK